MSKQTNRIVSFDAILKLFEEPIRVNQKYWGFWDDPMEFIFCLHINGCMNLLTFLGNQIILKTIKIPKALESNSTFRS